MTVNRIHIAIACFVIVAAAALAYLLRPHELMAQTSIAPSLETVIPRQFGNWTVVPEIKPVTPGECSDWEDEQVWVESALHKKSFLAVFMGKIGLSGLEKRSD